jgi:hypothetical protein
MGTLLGAHKFPVNMKSNNFVYARQYIDCFRGRFAVNDDNEESLAESTERKNAGTDYRP